jgi:electron transfer flavoprotein beta subunit
MTIAVCQKWVDDRPDVDPLTGSVLTSTRTAGASAADQAALEWALRIGGPVVVLTAGPVAAGSILRDCLAVGATDAAHVLLDPAAPSAVVARALVDAMPSGVDVVLCGAWSTDRGSGSVPAFIAAHMGAAQALGLVSLSWSDEGFVAERRLDRGRRERLSVTRPAVLSVEGGSARLRRAGLPGVIDTRSIRVKTHPFEYTPAAVRTAPYRPRPRVLLPPEGDTARERIVALTGALADRTPPQRVTLDPPAAADRILEQLAAWGYRP